MSLTACRAASLFICKANPLPFLTAAIYIRKWIHFPASPSRGRQRAEGAGRAAHTAPGARPSRAAPASRPVSIVPELEEKTPRCKNTHGAAIWLSWTSFVSLSPVTAAHLAEFEVREPKANLFWREIQDSGMVSVSECPERAGRCEQRQKWQCGGW